MAEKLPEEKIKDLRNYFLPQIFRSFYLEGILFFTCLLLGIFTAFKVDIILKKTENVVAPEISLLNFSVFFLLLTTFLFSLAILKGFKKVKGTAYRTLFVLAVLGGGSYVLNVWIGFIGFFLMIFLIVIWLKIPQVFIHDLVVILGIAGAGSLLGVGFTPETVIVLLAIFSLYDFIAVYKTKHMIKMAESMIEEKAILGIIIPINISDFFENLKKVKPGGKFYILGGGDIVFPTILAVSVLPYGILNSIIISLFSLAGLFFTFWLFSSQKNRNPIPALPLIALASILGYLITLFF